MPKPRLLRVAVKGRHAREYDLISRTFPVPVVGSACKNHGGRLRNDVFVDFWRILRNAFGGCQSAESRIGIGSTRFMLPNLREIRA